MNFNKTTSADIDRFRRCIIRELCFRKKVYPKWVFQKKMKQEQADFEIETMEKIKNYFDYLQIHLGPEQRKLF